MERRPLTRNSRPMMMTAIQAGTRLGLNCTSVTKAAAIKKLVGHGIEQNAHGGDLSALAGQVAVNAVGHGGGDE